MFPGNPIVLLPCSPTTVGPRRLAFTALWWCPRTLKRRRLQRCGQFRGSITRLRHWLSTLRAAIPDDDARLASGGGQPFPGGIPVYPLSSYRQFRPPRPAPVAELFMARSRRDPTELLFDLTSLFRQSALTVNSPERCQKLQEKSSDRYDNESRDGSYSGTDAITLVVLSVISISSMDDKSGQYDECHWNEHD